MKDRSLCYDECRDLPAEDCESVSMFTHEVRHEIVFEILEGERWRKIESGTVRLEVSLNTNGELPDEIVDRLEAVIGATVDHEGETRLLEDRLRWRIGSQD
jgi:hypothetical protein